MKPPDVAPGDVVVSRAGRDAGRPFVVLSLPEPDYALLADGKLRTLEKPKRKKLRHTQSAHLAIPEESMRTDADIRKALSAAMPEKEG